MRTHRSIVGLVSFLLLAPGCAWLSGGGLQAGGVTIPLEATVGMPEAAQEAVYSVPPQGGGPVARLEMQPGKRLAGYTSDAVASTFTGGPPVEIDVTLDDFEVRSYQAVVAASFAVRKDDSVVFERSYSARGRQPEQRYDWGGSFETQQAVDLTTDEAMRNVVSQFLRDARAEWRSW